MQETSPPQGTTIRRVEMGYDRGPTVTISGAENIFSDDLASFETRLGVLPTKDLRGSEHDLVFFRLPTDNKFTHKPDRYVLWKIVSTQEADAIVQRYRQDVPILTGPAVKLETEGLVRRIEIEDGNPEIKSLFVPRFNRLNLPFEGRNEPRS